MRMLAFLFAIAFILAFTACGEPKWYAEDSEGNVILLEHRKSDEPPTQAEKDLNFEKQLINRLQDAIEDYFETVDEAVITVEKPSETERSIDVALAMKSGEQLTEEQEAGIVNLIKTSFNSDLAVSVGLTQEQNKD